MANSEASSMPWFIGRRSLLFAPVARLLNRVFGLGGFTIEAKLHRVRADDGWELLTYVLDESGGAQARKPVRAHLFYAQGSNDRSVLDVIEPLAGFVMMGMKVVMVERRGVRTDGSVDEAAARKYATKERRVQDILDSLHAHLAGVQPGQPVIMAGFSEGGDVAAAVAVAEPRVTHLALFGTGGWSQADELRLLVRQHPNYLNIGSLTELEAKLEQIEAHPDSEEMWLGHPFRRWSSYMRHPPMNDLLRLDIPVFQAHGAKDSSVPAESARAASEAMKAMGKQNLRYVEYEALDHQFRDNASGKSGLPLVEVDVVRWLAAAGVLNDTEKEEFEARVRRSHPEWFS